MVEMNKRLPLFSDGLGWTLLLLVFFLSFFFLPSLFLVFTKVCWVIFYTLKSMIYRAITTKSKIFAPLFLYGPVGWLLLFFIDRQIMY